MSTLEFDVSLESLKRSVASIELDVAGRIDIARDSKSDIVEILGFGRADIAIRDRFHRNPNG